MRSGSGGRSNGKYNGDLLYVIWLKLIWQKRTTVKLCVFFWDVYFSVLDTVYCGQKYPVARAFARCKVIKPAIGTFNTTEYIHGLFSLYFIRHSKNFLGIMWNGPKSEENSEMFAHPYPAFALWNMTVKYEELASTKNYGKRKHCLMLLPGSLSSPNRRLTDVH